jgi:hypothetical protein
MSDEYQTLVLELRKLKLKRLSQPEMFLGQAVLLQCLPCNELVKLKQVRERKD